MKNFNQLSIGDKIYYTNHVSDILKENGVPVYTIVITSLKVGKDENLYINEGRTYQGSPMFELIIQKDSLHATAIRSKEYSYKIYFTDINQCNSHIKRILLERIAENETAIIQANRRFTTENEGIRVRFFELLNQSMYPDYKIIDQLS